jgi:hypothetical protein
VDPCGSESAALDVCTTFPVTDHKILLKKLHMNLQSREKNEGGDNGYKKSVETARTVKKNKIAA